MRFSLTLKFLARMYWIEMPSPSWGEVVVIIHVVGYAYDDVDVDHGAMHDCTHDHNITVCRYVESKRRA